MQKKFSLNWLYDNIRWLWNKVTDEIRYSLRWFISLTPGVVGRYLRRNCWGIGVVGNNVKIDEGCWIAHPDKIYIGNNVGINKGTRLDGAGGIQIGNNVLIGPSVIIWSQNHRFSNIDIPINEQGYDYAPVKIGDDVWIAARVTILPGVTIGQGAVLGAASVITRNVDNYSIMAGNPARKIGSRLNSPQAHNE